VSEETTLQASGMRQVQRLTLVRLCGATRMPGKRRRIVLVEPPFAVEGQTLQHEGVDWIVAKAQWERGWVFGVTKKSGGASHA